MPQFSIVTICYDDLSGLERTLASVAEQEGVEIEHIVVDGASSDGSPERIRAYAEAAPYRVDWSSAPDKGIYDAMNKGLARATGDVVVFMNSGDSFYAADTLHHVAGLFAEHHCRWLFGQSEFVDEAGTPLRTTSQYRYTTAGIADGLAYAPHQATYMERSLLDEIGDYALDLSYAADQELVLRAGLHAQPLVVPDVLAHFLAGGTHSGATGWQREHLYQEMRRRHGLLLANTPWVDSAYTKGMALYRDGRRALARPYHALRKDR